MYKVYVNIQEFTVDYCISIYIVFVHCVRSWYKLPHEKGLKHTLKIHLLYLVGNYMIFSVVTIVVPCNVTLRIYHTNFEYCMA